MDERELLKFYERLYFHEIEYRDKITGRLQLPLAIYISLLSLIGFMVRNINYACGEVSFNFFVLFLILSAGLIFSGVFFFVRAYFGHTYEFMPTASSTDNYRMELEKTYRKYENGDELSRKYLEEYLYGYYIRSSSHNAVVNDKRSANLHKSNTFIIFALFPMMVTSLVFNFGDVDRNLIERRQVVEIKEPLKIILPRDMPRAESATSEHRNKTPSASLTSNDSNVKLVDKGKKGQGKREGVSNGRQGQKGFTASSTSASTDETN